MPTKIDWSLPQYCAECGMRMHLRRRGDETSGHSIRHEAGGYCRRCAERRRRNGISYRNLPLKSRGGLNECDYCMYWVASEQFTSHRTCERCRHLRKFKISSREYDSLRIGQGNRCLVCFEELEGKVSLDHDHSTGKIRGVLHDTCNLAIGHIENTNANLESVLVYLNRGPLEFPEPLVYEYERWEDSARCRDCSNIKPLDEFRLVIQANFRYKSCKKCTELQKRGIKHNQYEWLTSLKEGCHICNASAGRLVVDHDHSCHPKAQRSCVRCIRGILCDPCNFMLGHMRDSIQYIQQAYEYLEGR